MNSRVKVINVKAFANCPNLKDVTCLAENTPNTKTNAFEGSYIEYTTLHVPAASIAAYKAVEPWKNFKSIVAIDGETPETQKCAKPTISYQNGKLTFSSSTEGAEYVSEITDADIKKHYDATIQLTATYNISVYATKSGYDDSDVATATLCWIDKEPSISGIGEIPARALLIQSEGGMMTVEGADDGQQISVYGINGTQAGAAVSRNGRANIATNLQPGTIAIVKIGEKSVKVVVK